MAANHDDSDARLSGEGASGDGRRRAVLTYRRIAESTANLGEKIQVVNLLVPLDATAAAEILAAVTAEAIKTYRKPTGQGTATPASRPAPGFGTARSTWPTSGTASGRSRSRTAGGSILTEILKAADALGGQAPDAAITVLAQLADGPIPFDYRLLAASRIAALEAPK